MGAATALAEVLGFTTAELRRACPGAPVEALYERSGKQELRSKTLLQRIAGELGRRSDSLELREEVAMRTDPAELCHACPSGFAPLAAALRAAFGARSG